MGGVGGCAPSQIRLGRRGAIPFGRLLGIKEFDDRQYSKGDDGNGGPDDENSFQSPNRVNDSLRLLKFLLRD